MSEAIIDLCGSFERIEDDVATGWACFPGRSGVVLEILADGEVVAVTSADEPRPDVAASGLSHGLEQIGFACRLPGPAVADHRRYTARVGGTDLVLPETLQRPLPARPPVVGCFSITQGYIHCRFALAQEAARIDSVLLEEGGHLIQAIKPVYDADDGTGGVVTASIVARFPITLRDGEPHRLTLRPSVSETYFRAEGAGHEIDVQSFVKGHYEGIRNGFLIGWAFDVRRPDEPVPVEVLDADRVVASGYADQNRSDVAQTFPQGAKSGFAIPLPLTLFDNGKHHLRLRCGGEMIGGRDVIGGPDILKVGAGTTREQRFVGKVDALTYRKVAGWVHEKGSTAPVSVRIEVDGVTLTTLVANAFERRLAIAGHKGYSGFTYEFPSSLMNGKSRQVQVVPVGATAPLPVPSEAVLFPLTMLPAGAQAPVVSEMRHAWPKPVPGRNPLDWEVEAGGCLLSVVVVNWNGEEYLDTFFATLAGLNLAFPYELLIIDHASSDGSEAVVQRWADDLPVRWIQRGANLSFSQSNNLGAREARGTFLLFANNDIEFSMDCVTPALSRFADPTLGLLGVRLLEPVPINEGWSLRDHHVAVTFKPVKQDGTWQIFLPFEVESAHPLRVATAVTVGAVTAALMMCRASDFARLGGFSEAYSYGLEDVDLCLRMSRSLGLKAVCDQTLQAVHDRSATRGRKSGAAAAEPPYAAWQAKQNRLEFVRCHGRFIARTILQEATEGSQRLARRPLRVTFAVTEASIHTKAGDYFTAMELGIALREAYGWEVMFTTQRQYDLADTDVLILMRFDYDLSRIVNASPSLLIIAWIRNRVDEWCDGPHLGRCHLVFASSHLAIDEVARRSGIRAHLLPIASNHHRFKPPDDGSEGGGVVFTGSYWGEARESAELIDLEALGLDFRIYGADWGKHPTLSRYWCGLRPYYDLPAIYASAAIVLDDSHPVTRRWDSLNSRVFDAIAAGSLVMTNCRGGAADLFGDLLPSFETAEELADLLVAFSTDPEKRRSRAEQLRAQLLEHHTYAVRARTLHAAMGAFSREKTRVAIKIGVPKPEEQELWGDYHFALALKRALERIGFWVRIDLLPDWNEGYGAGDDVAIVLRGLSRHKPAPGVINIMWLISHPDQVTVEEMLEYDHVFIASEIYAGRLEGRLGARVSPLLQCTDPALFFPSSEDGAGEAPPETGALFVGNTRGKPRQMVEWALQEGLDFALYGTGWAATGAAGRLVADHIPNRRLGRHYAAARIVLADHWPDMRAEGFLANRLFDAACCGAMVAVDDVAGIEAVFGDLVTVCRSPGDLAAAVRAASAPEARPREAGEALRSLVLAGHTFDHRAMRIAEVIAGALSVQGNAGSA